MTRTITVLCCTLLAGPALAQGFGMQVPDRNESLRLVRHDVQLRVDHPVARVVVTQEFENPHDMNLEAFFSYPVPPGATVTGLALWVNGARREARMLERQKAREIYDGIVRQKRDPALLEKDAGNNFRIRIFPVLARSRQRVELTFVQPVEWEDGGGYRVTLRRPPGSTIHSLRLGVELRAGFHLRRAWLEGYPGTLRPDGAALRLPPRTAEQSFARDIHLRYRAATPLDRPRVAVARAGDSRLFVAELPLPGASSRDRSVAVLLDASASMAPQMPRAGALIRALATRLDAMRARLALVPFGLLPRAPTTFADDAARRASQLLEELEPRGGTAFVPVFEQAMAAGARDIVLITDGASRYHQAELEHLLRLVHDAGDVTVSVVAVKAGDNEEPLADLAAATGGLYRRLDGEAGIADLARRLAAPHPPRRRARLAGGEGEALVLRADGTRLLVAGSVAGDPEAARVALEGAEVRLPLDGEAPADAVGGLYGATAIAARMRSIKVLGETEARRAEVVALSKRHHVLSEYTALLATETDEDYARPTSGQKWQRSPSRIGDDLPPTSFQSTPEPHEWAMIGIGLIMLLYARRRGWLVRAR